MPTITDPARELADFVRNLKIPRDHQADVGLAALWGVEPWSSGFIRIIAVISERAEELKDLTDATSLDPDQKDEMKRNLEATRQAFCQNGLGQPWRHSLDNYLSPATIGPLSMLSGLIRPIRSYPKLDDEEVTDLFAQVAELRSWLIEHQLVEQDFIRQALIDGLDQLLFRLERIKWLGWGYTVDSLRDVVGAYLALERSMPTEGINPITEAMVRGVGNFIKSFYDKTRVAKDVVETGDWLLRAYGGVMAVTHGSTTIAGLIGHTS